MSFNVKKDYKYYAGLNYKMEVVKVEEHLGGGYRVTIPELGDDDFITYGDTVEEAVCNMYQLKKTIFTEWKRKGVIIPEPKKDREKGLWYTRRLIVKHEIEDYIKKIDTIRDELDGMKLLLSDLKCIVSPK